MHHSLQRLNDSTIINFSSKIVSIFDKMSPKDTVHIDELINLELFNALFITYYINKGKYATRFCTPQLRNFTRRIITLLGVVFGAVLIV